MSIRKRGPNTYQVRVYVKTSADGRTHNVYETVHGIESEAKAVESALEIKYGNLESLDFYNMTVEEYLLNWLETVASKKAPKTYEFYAMHVNNRIIPALRDIKLRKLTPWMIQNFYDNDLSERLDGKNKPLSSTSASGVHRVLHAALHRASRLGIIPRNPASKDVIEAPKVGRSPARALTIEEGRRLLKAVGSSRHAVLIITSLLTGIRAGALLALKKVDVDLGEGVIHIKQDKTDAGARDVVLPQQLIPVIWAHMESTKGDLVFPGYFRNEEVRLYKVSHGVMARVCRHAEIPYIRFHDLRHTFATWLSQLNVSPRTLADCLGHEDASFAVNRYTHSSLAAKRQVALLIDDLVSLPDMSENPQKPQNTIMLLAGASEKCVPNACQN